MEGTRIDALPEATLSRNSQIPVMLSGGTGKMTVGEVLDLLATGDIAALLHAAAAVTSLADTNELFIYNGTDLKKILASSLWSQLKWRAKAIGEIYMVDTSKTGAEIPPSSTTDTIWVELTAGLTGVGAFNNGKLTSESVTGSAPLVLATATLSVTGSPMNGQTINLINTEGSILRPSTSPGTKQNDQVQSHWHNQDSTQGSRGTGTPSGTTDVGNDDTLGTTKANRVKAMISDGTNGTPRAGNETRMKNVGVKAYMRVK